MQPSDLIRCWLQRHPRKTIALILIMTVVSLKVLLMSANQVPQPSCNFVMNAHQQRVSWAKTLPVEFYLDPSVPEIYHAAIVAAADQWNARAGQMLIRIAGSTGEEPSQAAEDGKNVIYWMKGWDTEVKTEQARTTIHWAGHKVYEADISVNARDHCFFWDVKPQPDCLDVESLFVHEFGHALGLAHTEELGSVMAKILLPAKTPQFLLRRVPSQGDLKSLSCEYAVLPQTESRFAATPSNVKKSNVF